jgi:hypothetical protein
MMFVPSTPAMRLNPSRSYGFLPTFTIPGTTKTLSGDSVVGLSLLLGAGYIVYRFARKA